MTGIASQVRFEVRFTVYRYAHSNCDCMDYDRKMYMVSDSIK